MKANDRQVGGVHYATPVQHWDFAYAAFGEGYFKGQITKYVARWRKKNGIQDLEKAQHFLQKLMELRAASGPAAPMKTQDLGRICRVLRQWRTERLGRWARMTRWLRSRVLFAKRAELADAYDDGSDMHPLEAEVVWLVTVDELEHAASELELLIREQRYLSGLADPAEPTKAYVNQDGDGDSHARIL